MEKDGIPKGILNQPSHFDILERIIKEKYLPPLNFHQFFMINIDTFLKEYESHQFNDEVDKIKSINEEKKRQILYWRKILSEKKEKVQGEINTLELLRDLRDH